MCLLGSIKGLVEVSDHVFKVSPGHMVVCISLH